MTYSYPLIKAIRSFESRGAPCFNIKAARSLSPLEQATWRGVSYKLYNYDMQYKVSIRIYIGYSTNLDIHRIIGSSINKNFYHLRSNILIPY